MQFSFIIWLLKRTFRYVCPPFLVPTKKCPKKQLKYGGAMQ